jgi:hypothetical protein
MKITELKELVGLLIYLGLLARFLTSDQAYSRRLGWIGLFAGQIYFILLFLHSREIISEPLFKGLSWGLVGLTVIVVILVLWLLERQG